MQRFLIVDDNAIERTLYATIINYYFESSHIDFAADGLEVLDKSTKNDYEVIIVDIEMPRMNGIDFFDQLKNFSPHKAEKVIFSSANIDSHRKTFFNNENCSHISKPFSRKDLLHIMNSTIKKTKIYSCGNKTA